MYIHAGAGHGKTTLLSQVANSAGKVVWLSLDGENNLFTFINTLCEAVKQTFPEFDFSASEYLPFFKKNNFISMLAGALICSIENISGDFIAVMDDLHTIEEDKVKKLIACLIKYIPKNTRLCFGSKENTYQISKHKRIGLLRVEEKTPSEYSSLIHASTRCGVKFASLISSDFITCLLHIKNAKYLVPREKALIFQCLKYKHLCCNEIFMI